jgi:hypothetical protein
LRLNGGLIGLASPFLIDILFCMSNSTYPLRLSREDRLLFKQSARAEGITLASWLRQAARERAKRIKKKAWACQTYPDWPLSPGAENEKHYVSRKLQGEL